MRVASLLTHGTRQSRVAGQAYVRLTLRAKRGNMKKITALLVLLISVQLFGEEYTTFDESGIGADQYIVLKDKVVRLLYDESTYFEYNRNNYYQDTDGYNKFTDNNKTIIVIDGYSFQQLFSDFKHDGVNIFTSTKAELFENEIKKITSSKYLSEVINNKLVNYDPINLFRHYDQGCKCHPYSWKQNSIPFCIPGTEDYKTAFIDIEFSKPLKSISILNGFIDPNNLKLYQQNSRVEVMEVFDVDHKITYSLLFKDEVYFNNLVFTKKTRHIKVTIKNIFEGTKYKDICISAIIPHQYNTNRLSYTEILHEIDEYKKSINIR